MRIVTWNLERGGKTLAVSLAQERVLASERLQADVMVLTEPPTTCVASEGVVVSLPGRHGPWIAIEGKTVQPLELDIPYKRTAVATRVTAHGISVLIYGAVLPWTAITKHAEDLVEPGETSFEVFCRVLTEQARDIDELQGNGELVVWAGDFNQTLSGPNWGGSKDRRELLAKTLKRLEMNPWNSTAAHAKTGMHAIDLICGSKQLGLRESGRISPDCGDVAMSDHAGYWVDVDVIA